MTPWRAVLCFGAAAMVSGCTRVLGGVAELPATETPGPGPPLGINVVEVLLDTGRMRGITGAGEDLTIIPSMDSASLVDVDQFSAGVPPACRFVFAETATFGPDVRQFHKTTFQYPPKSALISEGAAAYLDADAARHAFDTLVGSVERCAAGSVGAGFVGAWGSDERTLHTRAGRCGREYQLQSPALLEVTYCGFAASVAEIVVTNMADNVPG